MRRSEQLVIPDLLEPVSAQEAGGGVELAGEQEPGLQRIVVQPHLLVPVGVALHTPHTTCSTCICTGMYLGTVSN